MFKYLLLLILLVSCGKPANISNLDNAIKDLENSTKSLDFSTKHLNCTMELRNLDLGPAIKKYNIINKDQVLFYIDHLIIECLLKKYKE